jgi:hypothetical protein
VKLRAILTCLAIATVAPPALAQSSAEPEPAPAAKLEDHTKKLEWKHPKFSTVEYIATGTLLAGLGAAQMFMKPPETNWRGGILVDQQMIGLGKAETTDGQRAAQRASDVMLYGMFAWPYLDAGVALARNSPEVAWQMSLINTQSHALTGLATFLIKRTVGRERPNESNNSSFLSGHASTAFTSAGLVCAHHSANPIYGNKYADTGACVTALMAATATGSLRVVGNVHYASDVFAGATLGLLSGWLLPKIVHYGGFSSSTSSDVAKKKYEPRPIVAWTAAPVAIPGGAMVTVSGITF